MKSIVNLMENYATLMTDAEDYIWKNAEVGYKEFKTNAYMVASFEKLGYKTEGFEGITGFTAYYDTGKKGPTVMVLAELDALYCSNHPEVNKETGAAHVCGHNMQCAAVLGVAAALKERGKEYDLCGRVKFAIVPAEEGIDLTYRTELVKQNIITFTSGKPELISRGLLDDVDAAMMIHIENGENAFEGGAYFSKGCNGLIRKKIVIRGKAAHAGGCPWEGVNALYAAELSLSACNALRETFQEKDCIRFHPIMLKGGESVNAIPDEVAMESYVRGANVEAIMRENYKINRAITGACLAMGATLEITDMPGCDPRNDDDNFRKLAYEVATSLFGKEKCLLDDTWITSSTDMGDVAELVPSIHGYVDGMRGTLHDTKYHRLPPKETCMRSASLQFGTLVELLKESGKQCYAIMESYTPVYSSVEEYLTAKKGQAKSGSCIEYEGENIRIRL